MVQEISKILENEPSFRIKQAEKAVFSNLIGNWNEATELPKDIREKLADSFPLDLGLIAEKILDSKDGLTKKALFKLTDGFKIESVLMMHRDDRATVCVSSQAGCAVGCLFCSTGKQGFKRNLSNIEIVGQVLFFSRMLKKSGKKITNIVFMGMGEPFLNYENVISAIKILNDKNALNIGARKISVSTSGITEGIEKFSEEKLQINLAISLHAPNNALRSKLMPINKRYPIEKLMVAVDAYIKKTNRKVMFEYLMLDGINDSLEQAEELSLLLKKPLFMVNLILFNPTGNSQFKPSEGRNVITFKQILEKAGISVTQRHRFGKEIRAGCGQLSGNL